MSDQVFQRYLLEAEERQLLSTVAKYADILAQRDHAWMRAMRQTGLRVGTFSQLTVHHAKEALRTGRLHYENAIAKRGRGGSVPVNRKAQQALRDLLRIRRAMGYPEQADQPLVMSRNHRGLSVRSYQARMDFWCQEAGLAVQATPHWFRHTLAKRVMKCSTAQDPRGIAKAVLNHASINSTAIYTQPDREDLELAMEEAS